MRLWLSISGVLLSVLGGCAQHEVPEPPGVSTLESTAVPSTIILAIGCTFRADRTTPYGHTVDTTPYLARLADEGVLFDRMLANAAWTRAGVAALVSGYSPARWGIDDTGRNIHNRALPDDVETLAERLSAAGWATAGATGNPNVNPVFGLPQGFEFYQGTDKLFRDGQSHVPGPEMVDRLIEQVQAAEAASPGAPVFAQVVFIDAHDPWDLRPLEQLRQGRLPGSSGADRYDASLKSLDEAFAELDRRLVEIGRGDRILIVTGDHGEGLRVPEWAAGGHGFTLYEPQIHIPLIVHGPGVSAGRRVGGIAQQLDILPTVLGLAGLPADPQLPGTDLGPAIRGEVSVSPTPEVLSVTRVMRTDRWRITTPEWTAIEALQPKKLKHGRVANELFPSSDRIQQHNIASANPWVAAALWSRGAVAFDHLKATESVSLVVPSDVETEQLRMLGYVE